MLAPNALQQMRVLKRPGKLGQVQFGNALPRGYVLNGDRTALSLGGDIRQQPHPVPNSSVDSQDDYLTFIVLIVSLNNTVGKHSHRDPDHGFQ